MVSNFLFFFIMCVCVCNKKEKVTHAHALPKDTYKTVNRYFTHTYKFIFIFPFPPYVGLKLTSDLKRSHFLVHIVSSPVTDTSLLSRPPYEVIARDRVPHSRIMEVRAALRCTGAFRRKKAAARRFFASRGVFLRVSGVRTNGPRFARGPPCR